MEGSRYFSGERFVCEQKDLDRAKSCPSEAKAMAQLKAITDLDKLFRRGIAFATIGQYGTDPKPWMDKARALGASEEDVQKFYQELIKAGKPIDANNKDMLLAALAMLEAGQRQVGTIEDTHEDPEVIDEVVETPEVPVVVEPEPEPEPEEEQITTGIGQTFSIDRIYPDEFEVKPAISEEDLKNLIEYIASTFENYGPNRVPMDKELEDKLRVAARYDLTINSVVEGLGLIRGVGPDPSISIKLEDQNELSIGVFDLGWDYYVDLFDRAYDMIDTALSDYEYDTPESISKRYKAISYFDYYNEFTNRVTKELEKIYGWAQECYEGFDGSFISGFDVAGGSILLRMPICASWTYEIKPANKSEYHPGFNCDFSENRGQVKAYYSPKTFYGPDNSHFYNTKGYRRNGYSDLGLDLRLD